MEMRIVRQVIAGLVCSGFLLVLSGCATKKLYHGIEATDLSGLFYGMERTDAERLTGDGIKEVKRSSGTVVTYVYDRGWTGCVGEGRCKAEDESKAHAMEMGFDVWTLGTMSYIMSTCNEPCQKGLIEVFYGHDNEVVGVRERPVKREGYCWNKWNKKHEGYPCSRIYDHRRPSTVSSQLTLSGDAITGKTAAQWDLYEQSKSRSERDFKWLCKAAEGGDYRARRELGYLHHYGLHGVRKDLVVSLMWYSLVETDGYEPEGVDDIRKQLTPEQLLKAEHLYENWKPGQCEREILSTEPSNTN